MASGGIAKCAQRRVVEAVAAVVALAVLDPRDLVPTRAAAVKQGLRELDVGQLHVTADVVDAPALASLESKLDAAAVVVHVDPAADVPAIAVERDRQPVEEVSGKERDDLLGELVGTVVVGAPRDEDIEPVGPEVGAGHEVPAGLGRRVR